MVGNIGRRKGGRKRATVIPAVPSIMVNGKVRTTASIGDTLTVFYPSKGLSSPTQQALRDGTPIAGATGHLYTIVAGDAGASEIAFSGTGLDGVSYTTTGVQLPANITINSASFVAGGAGIAPKFELDYVYNKNLDLILTLDFRNSGGDVLDTLVVNPLVAGPATIEGLEPAAENATDVLVTITDGSVSDTAVTAVSGLDATAPFVSTFNPADDATNVARSGNLVVTFAEAIFKGAGSITIGGVSVAIADCTVSGSTLTIPYTGLAGVTAYTPTWPSGFVKDAQGNPVAALTNQWTFTTTAVGIALAIIGSPQSNTTLASTHNYSFDSTGYEKLIVTAGRSSLPSSVTVEGVALTPIGTSGGDTSSGGFNQGYLRTVATQGVETGTVVNAASTSSNSFIPVGLNGGTVTSASYVTSNNSTVAKSVTPTSANNKILALFAGNETASFTPPTGMTEILAPVIINSTKFAAYTFDNAPNGSPYSVSFSSNGRIGLALFSITQV